MPDPLIELLKESLSESRSEIDPEIASRLAHEHGDRFKRRGASIRRFFAGVTGRKERVTRTPSQRKRSANSREPGTKSARVDLPEGQWVKDGIESPPARVIRPSKGYPAGLVLLNEESPVFLSMFEEWKGKVDGLHKIAVEGIVRDVMYEVYVLRVADAGNLPHETGYSRDDVYDKLLSEEALYSWPLGYVSQHAMIAPRIKAQLGIKVKL